MLSYKHYVSGLGSIALAVGGLVIGMACYLEPVRNEILFTDLLRVGGFTANRHGHTKPHKVFHPTLVAHDRYKGYFDVVVLGDSFTAGPLHSSWANYLAAEGWSVVVLPLTFGDWTLERLLSEPAFKATPPKVVIYQTAERNLVYRLAKGNTGGVDHCDWTAWQPAPRIELTRGSRPEFELRAVSRPIERPIDEQQIAYARDFLLDQVRKWLSIENSSQPQRFRLAYARFSSRDASSLLVLSNDLVKRHWSTADISRARCQLLRYREQVQANGSTVFVVMVAPDKVTAYHPDLIDQSLPSGVIDTLADPRLLMPRVDHELRSAIEAGKIDVYLPGDSHWGAEGHEIVGRVMVGTLAELGNQ